MAERRFTECEGEQHHFMGPEPIPGEDGENAGFTCKHCQYTTPAEECFACDQLFPLDMRRRAGQIVGRLCPECFVRDMDQ